MNLSTYKRTEAWTTPSSWASARKRSSLQSSTFSPLQKVSLKIRLPDISSTPHDNQRPAKFRMDSFTMRYVSDDLMATRSSCRVLSWIP